MTVDQVTDSVTPSRAEVERIRDGAEQEIRQAYGTEAVAPFAVAVVGVVLTSSPFVVASVAAAAAVAVVGVSVVITGPVLAAAVAAGRLMSPDVTEADFATMVRTLRELVAMELIREAEIVVHNALVETKGRSEREQGTAVRDALDPRDDRWRGHIERTAATMATAAVNEGIAVGTAKVQRTGRRIALRWVARDDGRTRPTHRRADGLVRGVGERFDVGTSKLRWPGDPLGPPQEVVNCRCILLPARARRGPQ